MNYLRIIKVLCICITLFQLLTIAFVLNEVSADDSGPEITNIYWMPKYPIYGDDVDVYAMIMDPDGIDNTSVKLIYCVGGSCYFPPPMGDPEFDNVWNATIPWDEVNWQNGTIVDFQVQAEDLLGHINSTDKIHFFFVSDIELSTEIAEKAYVEETVPLNGTALYNGNETAPVEFSNITVKIIETGKEYYTTTDINGYFSMDLNFKSPGEYHINTTISNRTMFNYHETSIMVIGITYVSQKVQMTTCYPNQQMWVNGTVLYNTEDPVVDSDVEIRVNGTLFSTGKTDLKGNYSFLITVPEELGQYIINITVRNGSLVGYNQTTISVTEEPLPDLAISSEDITFTYPYSAPLKDDEVNITVIVHNLGLANCFDITIYFYDGDPSLNNLIGSDTVAQLPYGDSDTCTVMWIAINGSHDIWVVVDPLNITEESFENNNNASKSIFVDDDFDDDGIGNDIDPDDDNDNYNDDVDAFPYNSAEWLDSDGDNTGNNADPDDDNDGLLDTEEDKNHNGIVDGRETDPLNPDTDGDGVNDKDDYDPLDPKVWEEPSPSFPWIIIALLVPIIVIFVVFVVYILYKKRKGKESK